VSNLWMFEAGQEVVDVEHIHTTVEDIISHVLMLCRGAELSPSQVRMLTIKQVEQCGPYMSQWYDYSWHSIATHMLFVEVKKTILEY